MHQYTSGSSAAAHSTASSIRTFSRDGSLKRSGQSKLLKKTKVILDSNPSTSLSSSMKLARPGAVNYGQSRTYSGSSYTSSAFSYPTRKSAYNQDEEEKGQYSHFSRSRESQDKVEKSSYTDHSKYGEDQISACGLSNIGNTCFMNSILQCLFSTPYFNEHFLKAKFKPNPSSKLKGHLAYAYQDLLKETIGKSTSRYNSVTPSQLKRCVSKFAPQFVGYGQHDSQEFLRFLLEGLSEDVNRVQVKAKYKELDYDQLPQEKQAEKWWSYSLSREDSIVTDLFQGQLMSKITCETCGYNTYAFDIFFDLSLPIPRRIGYYQKTSLHKCLEKFQEDDILDGDNQFRCKQCKKNRRCRKSLKIWRLPRILVIHLKRFQHKSWRREKLDSTVELPSSLDMSSYVASNSSFKKEIGTYKLYAISHHSGSLYGGHYVADAIRKKQWHHFNDSFVSQREPPYESESAYVLFYARSDAFSSKL